MAHFLGETVGYVGPQNPNASGEVYPACFSGERGAAGVWSHRGWRTNYDNFMRFSNLRSLECSLLLLISWAVLAQGTNQEPSQTAKPAAAPSAALPSAAPVAAPAAPKPADKPIDVTPPAPTRAEILRGAYGPYRANNDLLYYHLDIRVDPEKQTISGKNTIRFKMLEDGARIQLDLLETLQVDKILWAQRR